MSKKIRVADLPAFDLAERLQSPEDIAAYLSLVISVAIISRPIAVETD